MLHLHLLDKVLVVMLDLMVILLVNYVVLVGLDLGFLLDKDTKVLMLDLVLDDLLD